MGTVGSGYLYGKVPGHNCEHRLFLHKRLFAIVFHFDCNGWQNQVMCIKFRVKLHKSDTETTEMLLEAFGEHSLSQIVIFELH